jgi:transcription initiation factor TFIID TATA-box-binding protein
MADIEIVNIAASGDLGREIDIQRLVEDIEIPVANYDPDFNASFLRFDEEASELVILYTSGKYILRGGDSYDSMETLHNRFVELLGDVGIDVDDVQYEIKNVVCVADLERNVDLNQLAILLGMEAVEYEPEQFPGLVYRPTDSPCVLLIFSTGKVVVTGGRSKEDAERSFASLQSDLSGLP